MKGTALATIAKDATKIGPYGTCSTSTSPASGLGPDSAMPQRSTPDGLESQYGFGRQEFGHGNVSPDSTPGDVNGAAVRRCARRDGSPWQASIKAPRGDWTILRLDEIWPQK